MKNTFIIGTAKEIITPNDLLAFSTANKDAEFPFWNDVQGTFGAIVYSALVEKGIKPESVYIDRKARKVTYNGKTKKIVGSFNCNNILKVILRIKDK